MIFKACLILLLALSFEKETRAEENCTALIAYNERMANITSITTGASGKVCGNEKSCCTMETELKLRELGRSDYERAVKKSLNTLGKMLKSKSAKFNDYFKDLLAKSKKDFHEMFKRTYGIVYEQNSYVFSDFFSELEKYFAHGKSNLSDVMDAFFTILYQKMFVVMNSQYQFDDKYLVCVSEHMSELKPFGDVPQKLSTPLKRSFIAARTYAQSLNVAGDIVLNLVNLAPSDSCINSMTKMLHCPVCKNIQGGKICNNYCLNVMKGCLAYFAEVDAEWNNFVDAMSKVEQRLLGPFNIESVVEPINVKISEAIMNFQENAMTVSTKVFNGCGKPALLESKKRRRRQSEESALEDGTEDGGGGGSGSSGFSPRNLEESRDRSNKRRNSAPNHSQPRNRNNKGGGKRKGGGGGGGGSGSGGSSKGGNDYEIDRFSSSPVYGFLKIIKEIGGHVTATKSFWKRLPYQACMEEFGADGNSTNNCWNGDSIYKYEKPLVPDGLKHQQSNPEVEVDNRRLISLLNEQVYAVKSVTMQLRNAFQGLDVQWIDQEESFDAGSGSGFGPDDVEGSGDEPSGPPINANAPDPTVSVSATGPPVIITGPPIMLEPKEETTATAATTTQATVATSTIVVVVPTRFNTTAGAVRPEISINRAVYSYLLPTVVLWMGRSFNDWFDHLIK